MTPFILVGFEAGESEETTAGGSHPTGSFLQDFLGGKVGPNGEVEQDTGHQSHNSWVMFWMNFAHYWRMEELLWQDLLLEWKDANNNNLPQHVAQLNRCFGTRNAPQQNQELKVWPTQTLTTCEATDVQLNKHVSFFWKGMGHCGLHCPFQNPKKSRCCLLGRDQLCSCQADSWRCGGTRRQVAQTGGAGPVRKGCRWGKAVGTPKKDSVWST